MPHAFEERCADIAAGRASRRRLPPLGATFVDGKLQENGHRKAKFLSPESFVTVSHQEAAGRQMKPLPNVPAVPMLPDQQSTLPCEGE